MDRSLLVTNGYQFLDILDAEGVSPRAAIWVYNDVSDSWRLWLVPKDDGEIDDFVFYRQMSLILRSHPDLDLSTSDIEPIKADHPAIVDLGRRYDLRGHSSRSFSHTMLGDVFAAKGIILRMAMQQHSNAA